MRKKDLEGRGESLLPRQLLEGDYEGFLRRENRAFSSQSNGTSSNCCFLVEESDRGTWSTM
jgi:hypothetical protein